MVQNEIEMIEKVSSYTSKPIIIGGGQDVSYAIYKAYASLERTITFCSVDSIFNIGVENETADLS